MPTMEVIIYDDNGTILVKFKGPIEWHKLGTMPKSANDPIGALARRSGVYTSPAKHQLKHPGTLKLHGDAVDYVRARFDCSDLLKYERVLHDLWFLWRDTADMDVGRLNRQFAEWALEARLVYANWLKSAFEGHGVKGRDARYTVAKYLSEFRRGRMKTSTFDSKMDAARERLEMLRKGTA